MNISFHENTMLIVTMLLCTITNVYCTYCFTVAAARIIMEHMKKQEDDDYEPYTGPSHYVTHADPNPLRFNKKDTV